MPSKSRAVEPAAPTAVTVAQQTSVFSNPAVNVAAGSLAIAILALVIAFLTYQRTARIERVSRFESSYGSNLRLELRKFEKLLLEFRAYTFPSAGKLKALKEEFEELRVKLEQSSLELSLALKEIDKAGSVGSSNWQTTFLASAQQAELLMQTTAHPRVATEIEFRAKAEDSRSAYQKAVDAVRTLLDAERNRT